MCGGLKEKKGGKMKQNYKFPKGKQHSYRDRPAGLHEPHVCFSSFRAGIVVMRITAMFYLKTNYSGINIIDLPKKGPELQFVHKWYHFQNWAVKILLRPCLLRSSQSYCVPSF